MVQYLIYHIIALLAGVILDWLVGDPYWMPHPIRLIGRTIGALDRAWLGPKEQNSGDAGNTDKTGGQEISGDDSNANKHGGQVEKVRDVKREKRLGGAMAAIIILGTVMLTITALVCAYYVNQYIGIAIEAILTCYVLAAKSLCVESTKVKKSLIKGDIQEARYNVSMIVGRDTECLDDTGVAKAAIETVAENTSDGVIAPLIYTAIGGPVLGMAYKSVNTMDSMVGYHNDRYEHFGNIPARLDDVVNYLPARLSALMMIAGCFFIGIFNKKYSAKAGYKIWKRDRRNHKSPNSAQTESACAGCLGIKLAGDASYFGKIVVKPTIGDGCRAIEYKDITRANVLMFATEAVCLICVLFICTVIYMI